MGQYVEPTVYISWMRKRLASVSRAFRAPPRRATVRAAPTLRLSSRDSLFMSQTTPIRSSIACMLADTFPAYTGDAKMMPSAAFIFSKMSKKPSSVNRQLFFPPHPQQARQPWMSQPPSWTSSHSMASPCSSEKTASTSIAALPSLRALEFIARTFMMPPWQPALIRRALQRAQAGG